MTGYLGPLGEVDDFDDVPQQQRPSRLTAADMPSHLLSPQGGWQGPSVISHQHQQQGAYVQQDAPFQLQQHPFLQQHQSLQQQHRPLLPAQQQEASHMPPQHRRLQPHEQQQQQALASGPHYNHYQQQPQQQQQQQQQQRTQAPHMQAAPVLVLHGPACFLHGRLAGVPPARAPDAPSQAALLQALSADAVALGLQLRHVASNAEGVLVDALSGGSDATSAYSAVLVNPGACSADGPLLYALRKLTCPVVMVVVDADLAAAYRPSVAQRASGAPELNMLVGDWRWSYGMALQSLSKAVTSCVGEDE
eukprot:TRINITY_DN591_c0_g1_i1.p1 TRINITY_DN591_c0_g1~~TRINITY_DN591_c0_g1_i1.p1  ORF type:complete len:306 (+),score=123.27 TRINITY_DN591_c0_g1_i1:769-1686(+)